MWLVDKIPGFGWLSQAPGEADLERAPLIARSLRRGPRTLPRAHTLAKACWPIVTLVTRWITLAAAAVAAARPRAPGDVGRVHLALRHRRLLQSALEDHRVEDLEDAIEAIVNDRAAV